MKTYNNSIELVNNTLKVFDNVHFCVNGIVYTHIIKHIITTIIYDIVIMIQLLKF